MQANLIGYTDGHAKPEIAAIQGDLFWRGWVEPVQQTSRRDLDDRVLFIATEKQSLGPAVVGL